MNTFGNTRLLLGGIAATAMIGLSILTAVRSHTTIESPGDLARQALTATSPQTQAQAASRLAALAAESPATGRSELIASLRDTLANGHTAEVRAAAIVGLARTQDRAQLPLLVTAIEDDNALVAGRAVAAVQQLLGVRYEMTGRPFDTEERRRLAGMARADMAALGGAGQAWWKSHTLPGATW